MNFPGFDGNEALKARLSAAMASGGLSHAYIIYGESRGSMEKLAQILAAAMVCSGTDEKPCTHCKDCRKAFGGIHPDIKLVLKEKDKRNYAIEIIRNMAADAFVMPNEAEKKVYIIPEGDFLTDLCQNAALKVLEEPPAYASFIILAENPGNFLETLRSRCIELFVGLDDSEAPENNSLASDFIRIFKDGDPLEMASFAVGLEKLGKAELTDFLEKLYTALVREMRYGIAPDKEPYFKACDLISLLIKMAERNVGAGAISGALAVGANTILK
jgi:hypothetical protein